jgi:hypothetical protein
MEIVNIRAVPELADQTLECVFHDGKKRLQKYSGCNSFLVMI